MSEMGWIAFAYRAMPTSSYQIHPTSHCNYIKSSIDVDLEQSSAQCLSYRSLIMQDKMCEDIPRVDISHITCFESYKIMLLLIN